MMLRGALLGAISVLTLSQHAMAEPTAAATSAFNSYIDKVEAGLAKQHSAANTFLAAPMTAQEESLLRQGQLVIAPLTPLTGSPLPGALLHDWRGTAFVPGAKVADFERLLKDISAYPTFYSPQVLQASVLSQQGGQLQALMRVRQKHVITVVMDITYDIRLGRLDAQHGYSVSRSTKVSEIDSSGHAVAPGDEHGFLWRLNTYWTYEERDGGLYIQIESVTLTRSVPSGLGWVIQPFIEKIPRESLEFTLRSTSTALHK
jgi:hypothetical protein